jgi:hypothetical protein
VVVAQELARPIGGAIVDDHDQGLVVIGSSKLGQYLLCIGETIVHRYYDGYAGRPDKSHTDSDTAFSPILIERSTPVLRDAQSVEYGP